MAGWLRAHRQAAMYGGFALAAVALVAAWSVWSGRQAEIRASDQLNQARFALESENLPLAASEFARIAENYSGTRAAEEATVLLARVRLLQGQSEQAVTVLREFAPGASPLYRAQAFGLLGAAYENLGRWGDAAEAYRRAAEAALWPFLAAQFWSDAGRNWALAGDTVRALEAYRRIVKDFANTGPVVEAEVRIGELTKGSGPAERP
ncbi:MAG TPA: tetratricopeptide repeat protein [Gemmatimonadales bacterium]|nr:tetratricopeptide repeat protein [Gemmatimonadales bacterium]